MKDKIIQLLEKLLNIKESKFDYSSDIEEKYELAVKTQKILNEYENDVYKLIELEKLNISNEILTDEEIKFLAETSKVLQNFQDSQISLINQSLENSIKNHPVIIKLIEKLNNAAKEQIANFEKNSSGKKEIDKILKVIDSLNSLSEDDYIENIKEIFELYNNEDVNNKQDLFTIGEIIAEHNAIVGVMEISKTKIERNKKEAKPKIKIEDLESLFKKYNYDLSLLDQETITKILLVGDLNNIEYAFEFYKRLNINICPKAKYNQSYIKILYTSTKDTLDKIEEISIEDGLNIVSLLKNNASIFKSKSKSKGEKGIIGGPTPGGTYEESASFEDFVLNRNYLKSLGYDIKKCYEKSPSAFTIYHETLKGNINSLIETLKLYGIQVTNLASMIPTISWLKGSDVKNVIHQFAELGELEYLINNPSRLQYPPSGIVLQRIYYAKKNNIDYKKTSTTGREFLLSKISVQDDQTLGIDLTNMYSKTGIIVPKIVDEDSDIRLKKIIDDHYGNGSLVLNDSFIKTLDQEYFDGNYSYNIGGISISRPKALMAYEAIKPFNEIISNDDAILYSLTYNSLIDENEFNIIKNEVENMKRGSR